MIIDRDYEERLYSTGSDELDELLERAFCEGYDYAQREFNVLSESMAKSAKRMVVGGSNNNVSKLSREIGRSNKRLIKGNSTGKLAGFGTRHSEEIGKAIAPVLDSKSPDMRTLRKAASMYNPRMKGRYVKELGGKL